MSRLPSLRTGTIFLVASLVAVLADAASAQGRRASAGATVRARVTILPSLTLPAPTLAAPTPQVAGRSTARDEPMVLSTGDVPSSVAWTLVVGAREGGAAGIGGILQWRDDAEAWRHLPPDASLHRSGTGRMDVQMRFLARPERQPGSPGAAEPVRLQVRIEYALTST